MNGTWIKDRRKQIHITQEDLTARLQMEGFGVTPGSISNWENGRYMPPIDDPLFVKALAKALKMTVSAVLSAAGYEISTRYSDEALRGADIIDQLPDDMRGMAIDILEQMLRRV
jgi:transcriptional regulator with XRE-family HTH domain